MMRMYVGCKEDNSGAKPRPSKTHSVPVPAPPSTELHKTIEATHNYWQ
jgi:hypothetical protein